MGSRDFSSFLAAAVFIDGVLLCILMFHYIYAYMLEAALIAKVMGGRQGTNLFI